MFHGIHSSRLDAAGGYTYVRAVVQDRPLHEGGTGSYGHGGGCGTLLAINPEKHLVFAMVRNGKVQILRKYRMEVTAMWRDWINR
ncbi:MAG: serine hydrolase [Fuerstiella sp.]|nr:serine hydrolase [Fuerstiella sp.]